MNIGSGNIVGNIKGYTTLNIVAESNKFPLQEGRNNVLSTRLAQKGCAMFRPLRFFNPRRSSW